MQISEGLYVLSINTLPYNSEDEVHDVTFQEQQLAWLTDQLSGSSPSDRFIMLCHIYETAQNGWLNWTEDGNQQAYY